MNKPIARVEHVAGKFNVSVSGVYAGIWDSKYDAEIVVANINAAIRADRALLAKGSPGFVCECVIKEFNSRLDAKELTAMQVTLDQENWKFCPICGKRRPDGGK